MTRRTAMIALVLLGGCHHGSTASGPATAYPSSTTPQARNSSATPVVAANEFAHGPAESTPAPTPGETARAYELTGGAMATSAPASATPPPAQSAARAAPAPASPPLANVEACEGLSDAEITRPVLQSATSTRNLTRHTNDRQRTVVSNGVSIKLPAEEGHNAAYMQRLLNCQSAQARATSAATTNPLAVEGTRTRVVGRHGEYEIRVTNPTPELASEIQRRVEATVPAASR